MTDELNYLMDLDPLSLSAQDIDKIVEYHRKARANYELGVKPKKEKGQTVKLDLVQLGIKKEQPPLRRI